MSSKVISDDDILALFARYHYLTAEHVTRRFFGDSIEYVRKRLKKLLVAGYLTLLTDDTNHRAGRDAYIFLLTRAGQQRVAEMGYTLPDRFKLTRKPGVRMLHTLGVNHFFCALERLAMDHPGIVIDQVIHELDFDCHPEKVKVGDGVINVKPDGWVRLWLGEQEYCIALEYDRGTEDERVWKTKVAGLMEWAAGPYPVRYGADNLLIAVVAEPGAARAAQILRWIELALTQRDQKPDARRFYVTGLNPAHESAFSFFADRTWIEPFSRKSYPLLSGVERPTP